MCQLTESMLTHKFVFIIDTDDINNILFNDKEMIFFTNKKQENEDLSKIINDFKIDALILDMLKYDANYIKDLKLKFNLNVISFHEYNDYSEYSDLTVNYNFHNEIENSNGMCFLSGPEYIIFNEKISKTEKPILCNDYVFVSFGGADPSFCLEKFIKNIVNKLLDISFYIHIGAFSGFNINNVFVSNNITFLGKTFDLFECMAGAKYAITAAGNMMYELAYFGVPAYVIAHNSHQEEFAINADKKGCVKYLGLANDIDYEKLLRIIKLPPRLSTLQICIDCKGVNRIKASIEKLFL